MLAPPFPLSSAAFIELIGQCVGRNLHKGVFELALDDPRDGSTLNTASPSGLVFFLLLRQEKISVS